MDVYALPPLIVLFIRLALCVAVLTRNPGSKPKTVLLFIFIPFYLYAGQINDPHISRSCLTRVLGFY